MQDENVIVSKNLKVNRCYVVMHVINTWQDDSITDHVRQEAVGELLGKMRDDRFHKVCYHEVYISVAKPI